MVLLLSLPCTTVIGPRPPPPPPPLPPLLLPPLLLHAAARLATTAVETATAAMFRYRIPRPFVVGWDRKRLAPLTPNARFHPRDELDRCVGQRYPTVT